MADKIAISEHQALRNLYYSGFDTEPKLKHAHSQLHLIHQPTAGYFYADDVDALIKRLIGEQSCTL